MKRFLIAFMALILVGSVSYSQEVMPNLAAGSKALLFQFGGLNNLAANNFNGGFGAKYYLSSSMAVRGVLQFSSNSTSTPANPPLAMSARMEAHRTRPSESAAVLNFIWDRVG